MPGRDEQGAVAAWIVRAISTSSDIIASPAQGRIFQSEIPLGAPYPSIKLDIQGAYSAQTVGRRGRIQSKVAAQVLAVGSQTGFSILGQISKIIDGLLEGPQAIGDITVDGETYHVRGAGRVVGLQFAHSVDLVRFEYTGGRYEFYVDVG